MFELAPAVGMSGNYQIKNSLRFNAPDSAYMSRTQGVAGNRTAWTLSAWVKRCALSGAATYTILESGTGTQPYTVLAFMNDTIQWDEIVPTNSVVARKFTTPVLRDPASWYHIVFCWDSGNATATDRQRIYVNGTRVTAFSSTTDPTLSATSQFNGATATNVGALLGGGTGLDAYLSEVNFIDGQALTPSSFGKVDTTTGQWVAKKYTGTYGTNGFYLPFDDGTSTTTLGYDRSGNTNNWTLNNFSVVAGVNNDWMQDTPTNNYCVFNNISGNKATLSPKSYVAPTDGSLRITGPAYNWTGSDSTFYVSSGKWYWEMTLVAEGTDNYHIFGVMDSSGTSYNASQNRTVNDVISFKLDVDAGTLEQSVNGGVYTTISSSLSGLTLSPWCQVANANILVANFGQRAFAYTPPAGFKALCTKNLPSPTIKKANKYFDVKTYIGTGSTQSITGLAFQPDFVWGKSRSFVQSNNLYDVQRGVTKALYSDLANAETTDVNALTAFNADGFSVGSSGGLNQNTSTYVAWNWKASGAGVANTDGTTASTVSANPTSGFSIVTYNTSGSTTVGHGLGTKPSMIIQKGRSSGAQPSVWFTYHASIGATAYLDLHTTGAASTNSTYMDNTEPTSTVFTVGSGNTAANYGSPYVAYCFAEVPGYSKISKYTGNGSTDGPFVYCGFKPKYVMVKRIDAANNWHIHDTSRDTYNVNQYLLRANTADTESTLATQDILSNGFKIRTTDAGWNASGGTYIFMAFAEAPFKYGTAR